MRTCQLITFIGITLGFAGCGHSPQSALMPPAGQTILNDLTLHLDNGPSRVFAFTDHCGGFFEGQTFEENKGGGYVLEGQPLLKDVRIITDEAAMAYEQAERFEMWPHQIFRRWKTGFTQTQTVLSGQHGMVIEYSDPSSLARQWTPCFHRPVDHAEFTDGMALFSFKESPYLAAAMVPGQRDWRSAPGSDCTLTLKPNAGFTAIVCFHSSRDTLLNQMRTLAANPAAAIEKRRHQAVDLLTRAWFETDNMEYTRALQWAMLSGHDLVVKQFGTGIWAGLSWFHQSWGRDTFIALPGISLVTGRYEEAKAIIRSFADYQITDTASPLYGRVPNRVNSPDDIIYNTTDGTPWLIREIVETVQCTGDTAFLREMYPVMHHAAAGSLRRFTDSQGYLTHDDADTWMDARIRGREAWSPRGNRAVDIQALWYNQLQASAWAARQLGRPEEAVQWDDAAAGLKMHFNRDFYNSESNSLYDHLNSDNSPDHQIRPNQLFAVTVPQFEPLISNHLASGVVHQSVTELTYPYGIASLSQNDPRFHPYHHDQIYHYDAAYHNGLCWHWNAGPLVSAMADMGYADKAFELSQSLAWQILHQGMPGSLAELAEPGLDEAGQIKPSGTYSQAWSVSEFVRNFYQDYLGVRTDMTARRLMLEPALPQDLNRAAAIVNLGGGQRCDLILTRQADDLRISVHPTTLRQEMQVLLRFYDANQVQHEASVQLKPGSTLRMVLKDHSELRVNGTEAVLKKTGLTRPAHDTDIQFQTFRLNPDSKVLKEPNWLEKKILGEAKG